MANDFPRFLTIPEINPFFVTFKVQHKLFFLKTFITYVSALFICIVLGSGISSCKKQLGFSKSNLAFSVDTLVFDTVFTTIGSTTQHFKIYNKENRNVMIEEIELAGGENSPFRINVDGVSGDKHSNLELEAKDSLFVFVEVTLKVNGQVLPMVIEDSIRFRTNGVDQYVRLAVWGQDAYFHYEDFNEGTWPNDKPHVIYNRAYVNTDKTLNIQPNTKIYLHKNSMLFVYRGTLNVAGTASQPVIFQGDRLEQFYKDVAGQWYGIYFHEALPSTINYAIIKNGTAGLHLFGKNSASPLPTVTLTNTKIYNAASYGIFLYARPDLKAENCVIAKSGVHALFILEGATYNLNHCDLLGYGGSVQTPAVGIRNYYKTDGVTTISGVNGTVTNTVIYGNQSSEIAFDTVNPNNDPSLINLSFRNCLIKLETPSSDPVFSNVIWNSDPLFSNIPENKFTFAPSSPLNGNASIAFPTTNGKDIDENVRSTSAPDIGAYELN